MAAALPPWLADLEDDWVQPCEKPVSENQAPSNGFEISAMSSGSVKSRIPRRSSSASVSCHNNMPGSNCTRTNTNGVLQQLGSSAENSVRRPMRATQKTESRNVSVASASSVVRYDTVERRAKSSSPIKKDATMEWKKRLVNGEIGYGDETDLFGPSALENIFAPPTKSRPSNANPTKFPVSKLQNETPMPSSPPPWPSSLDQSLQSDHADHSNMLPGVEEEIEDEVSEQGQRSTEVRQGTEEHEKRWQDHDQFAENEEALGDADGSHEQSRSPADGPANNSTAKSVSTCRKVTEPTDLGSSGFSPVFISKHTTINGDIGYAPMDSQTARLMQGRSLDGAHGHPDDNEDQSLPEAQIEENKGQPAVEDTMPSVPEVSLPDDLPTGTPPITRLGSFVTTRRGGLSDFGSFKNRPLSPSPNDSRQASASARPIAPHQMVDADREEIDGSRSLPRAPSPTPLPATPIDGSHFLSPPKPRSSGSPLKLFGQYDTFTNKKLLRRMSQLDNLEEDTLAEEKIEQAKDLSAIEQSRDESLRPAKKEEVQERPQETLKSRVASKLSSFGEGSFDNYDFEADLSFPSNGDDPWEEGSLEGSPPPDVQPPGSRAPFRFHVEAEDEPVEMIGLKRKMSNRSTMRSTVTDAGEEVYLRSSQRTDHGSISLVDGKRNRSSPLKAPTPKRRRTLHLLELEAELRSRQSSIEANNFGSIRPRNPTPNQRRQEVHAEVNAAVDDFMCSSPRLQALQDKIEESEIPGSFNLAAQAKAVASEVAAFTLNVSKATMHGERKRSITTQDFLNEAMHIMSLIRNRNRPQSGLGSVEESDEDGHNSQHLLPSDLPRSSSALRISRPPSREGFVPAWRPRSQPQQDARIVSQLRRFQEKDDIDLLDTSLRSLRLEERAMDPLNFEGDPVHSDVDIRVSGPRSGTPEGGSYDEAQVDSFKTNPSDDFSTGRTMGTNSTRKSDNVATLAPESVAHLIPEEIAGMTYDRAQGLWVKLRSLKRHEEASRLSPVAPSNITSDDDPFGNIPDLSDDNLEEQEQIHAGHSSIRESSMPSTSAHGHAIGYTQHDSQDFTNSQQPDRYQKALTGFTSSTAPSKYSAFASSQPQVETRATSWSSEHLAAKHTGEHMRTSSGVSARSDPFDLADQLAEPDARVQEELHEQLSELSDHFSELVDSDTEEIPASVPASTTYGMQYHPRKEVSRQVSLRRQTFQHDCFPNIQRQREMSIMTKLPDKRVMSVSFSVSRPHQDSSARPDQIDKILSSPEKSTFLLSDLPEFTVHEIDEMHPSEDALSTKVAQHTMRLAGDRYALATQEVVKTLTDVHADELFWEDIKKLDLNDKQLCSLHGLDDFCSRVQELDISKNAISQLEGVPHSVRWLDASSNTLNSLTAWGHLMNLQHLDISNNSVDCLDGLEHLVHLRELNVDNNKISLLYGILELDGLLKLSARNNNIAFADFEQCQLRRLEDVDLSHNQITRISNLSNLPALTRLILDHNFLQHLEVEATTGRTTSTITSLSLQNNLLEHIDLSSCQALRFLNLDANQLRSVQGTGLMHDLNLLSLRNQDVADSQSSITTTIFQQPLHCRALHLSSNAIQTLSIPRPFHSIRQLELASCGLTDLPSDFGLQMPNLQRLNLNHNALRDARPLLNIKHLEELHLAGNRISRLRKSIATLSKLIGLTKLDIRENPFTLGFYAPLSPNTEQKQLIPSNASPESHKKSERCDLAFASLLPLSASVADAGHLIRLDEDTKLRRRVYELLLANSCKALRQLDGLRFDRDRVMIKDGVFDRLVKLGIVKRSEKNGAAVVDEVHNAGLASVGDADQLMAQLV